MKNEHQIEKKNFTEDVGIFFEQSGLPRMAGRILGWLLISDLPHQSIDELAEALMASKGSISTTTRLLIQIGLIERLSLPGVRHGYFRIRPGAWHLQLKEGLVRTTTARQFAERGLKLIEGKPRVNCERLEEMRNMYAFFERELPALLERWEQEREEVSYKVR